MTQTIEQLQAKNAELERRHSLDLNIADTQQGKIAELTAEVERLKTTPPYQRQDLHCVVSDISAECRERRQQLAIAEEHNARLREALTASDSLLRDLPNSGGFYGLAVMEANEQALSIPASREALDAYVADKVKETFAAPDALNLIKKA